MDKIAQDKHELFWLVNKIQKTLKPKVIVEIGIAWGGSLRYWAEILPDDGLLIGIDLNPKTPENLSTWGWDWRGCGKNLQLIIGDSMSPDVTSKASQILEGVKIDFLYLDGSHDPLQVFNEFKHYGELVRYGGAIGFHDINPSMSVQYLFMMIRGRHERCLFLQGTGLWWKEHLPNGGFVDNRSLNQGGAIRLNKVWSELNFKGWEE